jgi:hypothetical protein
MGRRYVCHGAGVPRIYPGSLDGVVHALRDAQQASRQEPGEHRVGVHEPGKGITPVRVFEDGQCTWAAGQEAPA